MEAEPRSDHAVPADAQMPTPGDAPMEDVPDKTRRLPIAQLFMKGTRVRAVF
jgi:hypothetical protein